MRRPIIHFAMLLLAVTLVTANANARGRKDYNSNSQRKETPAHQPNSSRGNGRPGNFGRPSDKSHNNAYRPEGNRPGHNNNNWNRPGHDNFRPGHNNNNWNRPPRHDNWHRPQRPHGHNHGFRPGPPPMRPYMPAHYRWHRPTPPRHWRPAPGWRPFHSILGISFGSAINISINALVNSGYSVSGYGNDAVYVTNVPMINLMWPDATLYYGNNGLYASEFVYSTSYYDVERYNLAFNSLVRNYGQPFDVDYGIGGAMTASWWGNGNQFIRLTFNSGIAANGGTRYYTTLSFGN